MSKTPQILDGVFAVNKPGTMTSAALSDILKRKLTHSDLFNPYVKEQEALRDSEKQRNRGRLPKALRGQIRVKIGHGGTLDPSASGVVSFGVGRGTKALDYLQKGAEKGYEAVVLFGVATDMFDAEGKVVGRKGWEGVTREMVEKALSQFRGRIQQRPSVYSALSRGGVRMYEYARKGQDIPELEKRDMFVKDLEVVEWYEGGAHTYHWPAKEIEKDRKEAFVKVLRFEEIGGVEVVQGSDSVPDDNDSPSAKGGKRKLRPDFDREKRLKPNPEDELTRRPTSSQETPGYDAEDGVKGEPAEAHEHLAEAPTRAPPCPAPAARIRMTVSSGFYVRSLCHDLGVAVGSLAIMSSLVRTKQACFELGANVIDYEDFNRGEEVWGPKVASELNAWGDRFKGLQAQREASKVDTD